MSLCTKLFLSLELFLRMHSQNWIYWVKGYEFLKDFCYPWPDGSPGVITFGHLLMKYFSQMKWCFHVFLSRGYLWYFFLFIFLPIDLLYYLIIPPLGNFFGQRHNIHKCPLFKKAGMLPRNPHHALSFFSPPCKFPSKWKTSSPGFTGRQRGVREERGRVWSPEISSVGWLDGA